MEAAELFRRSVVRLEGLVSAEQAAKELGVSPRRVRQFLKDGRLLGTKLGHYWLIDKGDLAYFKSLSRKPGRPPYLKRKVNNGDGS